MGSGKVVVVREWDAESFHRRVLELEEAELLSPDRLQKLAREQNLVTPAASQVVHLETKGDGTVAMVK